MSVSFLDDTARRRNKRRNLVHSVLLIGGMIALLTGIIWLLFDFETALWALAGWAIALLWAPRISPQVIMRMYRAHKMTPAEFPSGFEALNELVKRAELPRAPALYYIPSTTLNAFTIGRKDDAIVAITDGLIRALNMRELSGVLAHELSHIRNNDLWVMSLADSISRLTSYFAIIGIFLLFLGLPMLLFAGHVTTLFLALVLIFAPTFASLLQLALSRAREFDADLDGAGLTGDPVGLASALKKLEQAQGSVWEQVFMPGRKMPDPSLLRTHPATAERIERLLSLYPEDRRAPFAAAVEPVLATEYKPVNQPPRWRHSGLWY